MPSRKRTSRSLRRNEPVRTARESARGLQQAVAPRPRAYGRCGRMPQRPRPSARAKHTHPIQKRRRHHAATDDRRCRVADVDHHKRFGGFTDHVSVRAAHGDGTRLCAQHVRARESISRRWRRGREHDGRDMPQRPMPSARASSRPHTHPIKKRRRHHAAPDDWRRRVANVDHHQRLRRRHVSVRAAHGDGHRLCAQHVRDRASERVREGMRGQAGGRAC
jgi:hypothetical protein